MIVVYVFAVLCALFFVAGLTILWKVGQAIERECEDAPTCACGRHLWQV